MVEIKKKIRTETMAGFIPILLVFVDVSIENYNVDDY